MSEAEERSALRRVVNMKNAINVAESDNWNKKEFSAEEFELKIPRARIQQYVA